MATQNIIKSLTKTGGAAATVSDAIPFSSEAQFGKLLAVANGSSGSATGRLILVEAAGNSDERVVGLLDFTATATARRTDLANTSSSSYVCEVSIEGATGQSANVWDLFGHTGDGGQRNDRLQWYIEVSGLTTITSVTLMVLQTLRS